MKISIQRYPEQRGRLILAGRSVATQPLAHSLTAESGRNQKCKSRIKSWVEIQSLTSEEKKKKDKQIMQKPSLTINRPIPTQALSNCYFGKKLLLPTSPPLVLLLNMTLHGMEYLFGQSGSAVLAVSHPNLWPTPSYSWGRAGGAH